MGRGCWVRRRRRWILLLLRLWGVLVCVLGGEGSDREGRRKGEEEMYLYIHSSRGR